MFSPWGGPIIQVADPQFDLATIVQAWVAEEELLASLDVYDPINSQSLLSSLPTTPATSPRSSPMPDVAPPPLQQPEAQAGPSRSHSKAQSRQNRKCKRERNRDSLKEDYATHPHLHAKHTHATEPLSVKFDLNAALHTSSGYVGLVEEMWKRQHSLEELLGPKYNFQHCPWGGGSVLFSSFSFFTNHCL